MRGVNRKRQSDAAVQDAKRVRLRFGGFGEWFYDEGGIGVAVGVFAAAFGADGVDFADEAEAGVGKTFVEVGDDGGPALVGEADGFGAEGCAAGDANEIGNEG